MSKLLICWLVLTFVAINGCQSQTSEASFTRIDLEQFMGARLPSSATEVQYATEVGIDRIVYLRFRLPYQDVTSFLASIQFNEPLRSSWMPFPSTADVSLTWWLHNNPASFVGGSQHTGAKVYELVIDQSNAEYYVVYLRVYEV